MFAVPTPVRESPEEDRSSLAKMLMTLFEHWQLSTEEQLDALGMSPTNRAALTRYRKGEPLANSRDTLERAGHLLGIHKNLRLMFPHNRDLAYAWMKRRNRAFENLSPIDVIRGYGFVGLLMVRSYLDRARGQ
ncbi:MbcA/ParS/Xre antitoxin family protein [Uliginosibacterium sediminicola]|uniref:MbcA/ParS/Xre antitoxin family protein n=1 Tax=Uliginosibacterium sediminicola TaxID=2024550 RepID=A0ABU9YZH1_9RHOO